jgi:hypothetical protein
MLTALAGINEKVAAIAPLYQDLNRKNKQPVFFRKSLFDVHYFSPIEGLHKILQAISSGTMINLRYLPEKGLMNESLFIDWVDPGNAAYRQTKTGIFK